MSGLKSVKAAHCLTLPCDMPFLKPAVADYLFHAAEAFDVAVPMWPNGRLETLLMVLERKSGLEIAETLCRLNRPRSDDIPRGASKVLFASPVNHIKTLDPELKSFININSKEDLKQPQTRRTHGAVIKDLQVNRAVLSISDLQRLRGGALMLQEGRLSDARSTFASCRHDFEVSSSFFWAAVSGENIGEALQKKSIHELDSEAAIELDFEGKEAFLGAANNYRMEAEMHEENRCWLLAERARSDKSWCESVAMGKHNHAYRYPSKAR